MSRALLANSKTQTKTIHAQSVHLASTSTPLELYRVRIAKVIVKQQVLVQSAKTIVCVMLGTSMSVQQAKMNLPVRSVLQESTKATPRIVDVPHVQRGHLWLRMGQPCAIRAVLMTGVVKVQLLARIALWGRPRPQVQRIGASVPAMLGMPILLTGAQ